MILEVKTYTKPELSQWFGYKDTSALYKKSLFEKKMEELKEYAEFEIEKKKIKITKVYIEEYEKPSIKKQNDLMYQKYIMEVVQEHPLQLYITATGRIIQNHGKTIRHKTSTVYNYVRTNMKRMFITEETHGMVKKLVWCHRLFNDEVDFVELTEEQTAYWQSLMREGIKSDDEIYKMLSLKEHGQDMQESIDELIKRQRQEQWEYIKSKFYSRFHFEPVCVQCFEVNAWELIKKIQEEKQKNHSL